jgi:hypothetical protein
MTDEVMYEIRELTGQNYVNRYAGEKAETEPTIEGQVGTVTDEEHRTKPDAEAREPVLAVVGGN